MGWPEKRAHGALRAIASNLITDMARRAEQKTVPLTDYLDVVEAMPAETDICTETTESGVAEAASNTTCPKTSEEKIAAFWDAVASSKALTENEYRVAHLTWGLHMPDPQIAKELNTTKATVYAMRSRARRKIKALANDRSLEITFTDEVLGPPNEPDTCGEGGTTA